MDEKQKGPQKEPTTFTQIISTTHGLVSETIKLSGNVVSLPGVNSTATQTQASVGVIKKFHNVDSPSSQRHAIDLNSSQSSAHPKKKGGFVITSVKDNVDGDESPDDLDESHASYSDLSYSKTTDIDHDQESSASEDTLHLSLQDTGSRTKNAHQNHIENIALVSRQVSGTSDQVIRSLNHQTAPQVLANVPAAQQNTERKQSSGFSPGSSLEFSPDLPSDSSYGFDLTKSNTAKVPSGAGQEVSGTSVRAALPKSGSANQNQAASQTKPFVSNSKTTNTSSSTTSVSANSASSASSSSASVKPTSSTNATLQKGGSRVYKVVKRETGQPVRKDIGRWFCFDYGDVQTPNLAFVAPSASDSRLNVHDQLYAHSTNQISLSMSSTSVPSSSSAYSLQHSDSASSLQRDPIPQTGSNSAVQHSTSTSSVNQELEARKLLKSFKKGAGSESFTGDDRLSGESISEQELLKNAMQSSDELSINQEQDDDSGNDTTSTGGIDTKIQKAMDLVKKHLMMAVRDEVDELKEKIAELTSQNETLLGILHPEQLAALQPKHTLLSNRQQLPVQSMQLGHPVPLYQQQHSVDQSSTATSPEHASQPLLPHSHPDPATFHQSMGKKHSLPSNPIGFSLPNQVGPLHRSQGAIPFQQALTKPTSLNLTGEAAPLSTHSQQPVLAQQQVIQKQPQQHLITQQLPRPVNYQSTQALQHQSNLQVVPQQQVVSSNLQQLQQPQGSLGLQFSPQQIQALLQLVYPQLTNQFATQPNQIPQGFQPTQGLVQQQQPGLSLPSQQTPLQAGQYQPYQQQQTLSSQQTGQLKNAALSQVTPPTLQGQFMQSSQSSLARVPVQASQSAPVFSRQPQPPAHTIVTSPTMSGHHAHPHGSQQMQFSAVQSASVPTPSGIPSAGVGSSTDQKPPSL